MVEYFETRFNSKPKHCIKDYSVSQSVIYSKVQLHLMTDFVNGVCNRRHPLFFDTMSELGSKCGI